MYQQVTHSIKITVQSFFLADQSDPEDHHYVWAYHVKMENEGSETVQLRRRHWKITDGYGRTHEVFGVGVVGEQPVLRAGDVYEYTSGTPLSTPSGIMTGVYMMEKTDGEMIEVKVPTFSLDSHYAELHVN